MMRKILLVLSCWVFTGNGRRMQMPRGRPQSSPDADEQRNPSRSLASFFQALDLQSAFSLPILGGMHDESKSRLPTSHAPVWRRRPSRSDPVLMSEEVKVDLNQFKVGQQFEGKIKKVESFGAYVDIGAKDDAILLVSDIHSGCMGGFARIDAGVTIVGHIKEVNGPNIGVTCNGIKPKGAEKRAQVQTRKAGFTRMQADDVKVPASDLSATLVEATAPLFNSLATAPNGRAKENSQSAPDRWLHVQAKRNARDTTRSADSAAPTVTSATVPTQLPNSATPDQSNKAQETSRQLEEFRRERAKMKEEMKLIKGQRSELTEQRAEVEAQMVDLKAQIESIRSERSGVRNEIEELKRQRAQLRSEYEEIAKKPSNHAGQPGDWKAQKAAEWEAEQAAKSEQMRIEAEQRTDAQIRMNHEQIAHEKRLRAQQKFEEERRQAEKKRLKAGIVQINLSEESERLLAAALTDVSSNETADSEQVKVERRIDSDGGCFTQKEFQDYYGGSWRVHWEAATPVETDLARIAADIRRTATVPPKGRGNEDLRSFREALPTFPFRAEILKAINENQVIIIEGDTGCGKTTQVGQFIIEDAAEKNVPCSVVCTQPRRISAIGVSERVADERGEKLGGTVGYSVRQDRVYGSNTHLLFCTTGILLRRLEHDQDLDGLTHVIVDEVHERGIESDFLLLALRDLARRRVDLKIILMSATLDRDLFSKYFNDAPGIVIPGRTFPVQTFYLEDAINVTGHILNPDARWSGSSRHGKTVEKTSPDYGKRETYSHTNVEERYHYHGQQVMAYLRGMEQDEVNFELIASLLNGSMLQTLASSKPVEIEEGAPERPDGVLIFVGGAREIDDCQMALHSLDEFMDEPARSWVLPLHGGLDPEVQKKVFETPPPGVRKVVCATNVAETSITIPDIGYVIDTCRMKEMRFDPTRNLFSLEDTVVSRTNARQRRGRAGRRAPGVAVHVGLTRYRHDRKIDDHQRPEVRRVPLEKLVLRIHATGLHARYESGRSTSVCAELLEPPDRNNVKAAVEKLERLGALEVNKSTGQERLTALGKHLANLPLDIRLGKLVLFGAAFGPAATDAALTIAAALTHRSPFLNPAGKGDQDYANRAKQRFADSMCEGPIGRSDHLAILAAYQAWDQLSWSGHQRYEFCRRNFLSMKTMRGMADMKRSLLETLSDAGFVDVGLKAMTVDYYGREMDCDGVLLTLTQGKPVEPCPPTLVTALLCAALFPQVVTATIPDAGRERLKFTIKEEGTGEKARVKLHPSSAAFAEETLTSPYMVYQELVTTNQKNIYVRGCTTVPPLAIALFGGSLVIDEHKETGLQTLIADGWIKLAVPPAFIDVVIAVRQRLEELFDSWVSDRAEDNFEPDVAIEHGSAPWLKSVIKLLRSQDKVDPLPHKDEFKVKKTPYHFR